MTISDKYIGKVYGKWTILERDLTQKRPAKYFCRCECGVKKIVYLGNIKKGFSTQCTECANEKKAKELYGKKFGFLTVITSYKKNKRRLYLLKCDCGTEYESTASPKGDRMKCCKWCSAKRRSVNSICVGKTYHYLDVLEYDKKTRLYKCKCRCGAIVNVRNYKISTKLPSCGCYWRKENEERARRIEGMKFHFLKIVKFLGMKKDDKGKSRAFYKVRCKCGKTFNKSISYIFGARSCGCLRKELASMGSSRHNSKVTEVEVASIRELFQSGLYSRKELSKMFEIKYEHACTLIKGVGWSHV